MKSIIVALLLLVTSVAFGQTRIAVDIDKASLTWNAPTAGGTVQEYKVKCGPATGDYTKTTVIGAPTLTAPVRSVIAGPGVWFCVVTAANQFGESGPSNEIAFEAGTKPGDPTGLVLTAG